MDTIQKRYLNIDGLAEYLHVPKSTIYKMVESRSIPFIRFGGKHSLRFDVKAIDKWMEKQVVPAVTP